MSNDYHLESILTPSQTLPIGNIFIHAASPNEKFSSQYNQTRLAPRVGLHRNTSDPIDPSLNRDAIFMVRPESSASNQNALPCADPLDSDNTDDGSDLSSYHGSNVSGAESNRGSILVYAIPCNILALRGIV